MQFNQVQLRPVAFVLAETIFRETGAEVAHNRVPRDFRDHARGGYGKAVAIAIDDSCLRQRKRKNRQTVDENVLWLKGEPGNRRAHRLMSRAQDIDGVDLDGVDNPDGPDDGVVCQKIVVNLFAFLGQELFRIVQLPVPKLFRKNDRGRYDRSGQCPASGFVDAGDGGDSERAQFTLMPEPAAAIHGRKILKS
jgi:hypothetical protein